MIVSREFKPTNNDIIYHYCSANAFHSICTSKRIRLTDLFSMNDYLEIHWGYSIWEQAATNLLPILGKEFLDNIDKIVHNSGLLGLIVASCFSLNGDVLSQWRAYSDDGKGYAIGFKAADIIKLPVRPLKILYDRNQQIKEAETVIKTIFEAEKQTGKKYGNEFNTFSYLFGFDLSSFKNPAYSEEQEIRLIHLLDFKPSNKFLKLEDAGGIYFGEEKKGEEIKFFIKNDIPTVYIELDFTNNGKECPIKEVIIGPKNDVIPTAISIFLETIKVENVIIKKSKAS